MDPGEGWGDDSDNDGHSDRDLTAPNISLELGHISLRKLLKGAKVRVTISSNEPGQVEIQLTPRWLSFDRTVAFRKAGEQSYYFKPRLSARRRMQDWRSVTVTAKVWFRDAARNLRQESASRTAKRSRSSHRS